jgi:preprotein translocase subunit SecD
LPQYDATSGANDTWTITMKPTALASLKDQAVTQAIETIRNRVDQLGVAEPMIEEHGLGQYQILVELPGVDDPARVKEIIKSTAVLDIRLLVDGPFNSEQAALQGKGGRLNADEMIMQGRNEADGGETWYVVSRIPAVRGTDLRSAQPTQDESGRPAVGFNLTGDGGRKFYAFTSAHVGDKLAVVLDGRVQSWATIKSAIPESLKAASQIRKLRISRWCSVQEHSPPASSTWKSVP